MTKEQRENAGCPPTCTIQAMHYHCDDCGAPQTDHVIQVTVPCPAGGNSHLLIVCDSCAAARKEDNA